MTEQTDPTKAKEPQTPKPEAPPSSEGSRMRWVRPIISIAMAGTVIYGFIVKMIPWEAFAPIAIGAIGYWYYQRDKSKKSGIQ